MAVPDWRKGTLIRIEDATPNTKRFFLQVNDSSSFAFLAGQFVTLDLPIHSEPKKRLRSYSISSWPDQSNTFELLIVFLEGGAASKYFFEEAMVGTEISFRGPVGSFILPAEINTDLFLVCTGTGIAPFRSMLHDIRIQQKAHQHIYLLFGCRKQSDLLYYNEMQELQERIENFTYIPSLSRQQWEGATGYVHSLYEEICRSNRETCTNMEEVKPACFYLCGWRDMIDEARRRIVELGYDRKSVKLELYG